MTSVVVAFSFMMLAASGLVLFVAPPGRVANWTDWSILGLTKSEWTGLHIWFGTVFLAMTIAHVVFNWRPLLGYFRDRARRRFGFRLEWAVAACMCVGVLAGTRWAIAPFSTLLAWNEDLKESWDRAVDRAPVPHAELLSVAQLAQQAGVEPSEAMRRLAASGIIAVSADAIVRDLATQAGLSAQRIYELIRTAGPGASAAHVPPGSGGGVGWKTVKQYCQDEGIAVADALARLRAAGIDAGEDQILRDVAREADGRKPYELLAIMRGS